MNLESLKEQFLDRFSSIWERVRDSDIYIQLRERYQNLTPTMQKIIIAFGISFAVLFTLLIPYTFLSSSWDSIDTFENNVRLIRDYYRVQRELASTPMVPETPQGAEVANLVQSVLTQAGLTPEQNGGTKEITPERDPNNSLQPAGISEHGVEITLLKLNLKQIADIGSRLSQLGQGLHLTALDMNVNSQNDHYYDAFFRITGFSVLGASLASDKSGDTPAAGGAANARPKGRGAQ